MISGADVRGKGDGVGLGVTYFGGVEVDAGSAGGAGAGGGVLVEEGGWLDVDVTVGTVGTIGGVEVDEAAEEGVTGGWEEVDEG